METVGRLRIRDSTITEVWQLDQTIHRDNLSQNTVSTTDSENTSTDSDLKVTDNSSQNTVSDNRSKEYKH